MDHRSTFNLCALQLRKCYIQPYFSIQGTEYADKLVIARRAPDAKTGGHFRAGPEQTGSGYGMLLSQWAFDSD